eukprot:TRINITY_DN15020_c0_g1_i1.p1 TRINITY_DN15020_c0_g1~~TRINITY_DN15020_c0_g1_i1.p1  ORF type:complete len:570 (-),score=80.19 TRINITY_DN15020_c0_g1_i1:58-1767(-)
MKSKVNRTTKTMIEGRKIRVQGVLAIKKKSKPMNRRATIRTSQSQKPPPQLENREDSGSRIQHAAKMEWGRYLSIRIIFRVNMLKFRMNERKLGKDISGNGAFPPGVMLERRDLLRTMVRKGIPDDMRGMLWQYLSGSLNKRSVECETDYKTLISEAQQQEKSIFANDIEKDLNRSLPEHPFYHTDQGIIALRNVLLTYATLNPDVGYSQSMNLIVALLLLYMNEESAFWMLRTICEDIVPENYHHHMIGTIVDQTIFEDLLETHLPNVSDHLKAMEVPLNAITQPWFFSFFVGYVPLELALHVIDCFFFDGPSVLFAVGIAIFKHREAVLLDLVRADQVIDLIKQRIDNFTVLLQIAFQYMDIITKETIQDLRNAGKFKTIQEMEFTNKTSTIRKLQGKTNFTQFELETIYDRFQLRTESLKDIEPDQAFRYLASDFLPWLSERFDFSELLYKHCSKKGSFDFLDFVISLSHLQKGKTKEKLQYCFQLYETEGLIDKGDFYNILDVLVRLEGGDVALKDLNTFIMMVFEKTDKDKDGKVSLPDLLEEVVNKPLLEIYICANQTPDWLA